MAVGNMLGSLVSGHFQLQFGRNIFLMASHFLMIGGAVILLVGRTYQTIFVSRIIVGNFLKKDCVSEFFKVYSTVYW